MMIKNSEQQSGYARSLIEASHDPLITINTEGKIMDMNNALAKITGLRREDLTGSDFLDYFTEPEKARQVYRKVFAKGSIVNAPLTLKNKYNKLTDVLLNGSIFKDNNGQVLGVVMVARDVTSQKRIASELTDAKIFAELSTGVAEQAQSRAEKATKVAEEAVVAKQQFLSNMSHEIRTPMNAIIGFTRVLMRTDLSERQKEYLEAIQTSGDSLIVLINDILDLAKVDAGRMTFEKTPFKMAASISAMLHLFDIKVQEKNVSLIQRYDNTIPSVLVGDPIRLHQVILNLVSNAVKFTEKGEIIVETRMIEENPDHVVLEFSVIDTGIGIPANQLENIFENFQQASTSTTRLYGGTGLGLAIVKQLVEPQGGTVKVTSTPGVGSTFSFTLPFLKTNENADKHSSLVEIDNQLKNIRVLVVEDVKLNQLLMKTLLDDFGFERDIAVNGQIAIEKLRANSYDLILMDLQMPVMDGFTATKYIRDHISTTIPIIALTADVTTTDLQKCKEVGMNDYVSKPIDEKILYNKIVSNMHKVEIIPEDRFSLPTEKEQLIDLAFLKKFTKEDPALLTKLLVLYSEQIASLLMALKKSLKEMDWHNMNLTSTKIAASFAMVGIKQEYEELALLIQKKATTEQGLDAIRELVEKLDSVCALSCMDCEREIKSLQMTAQIV
jgi:PAS domain S-box-containing protein